MLTTSCCQLSACALTLLCLGRPEAMMMAQRG